MMAFMNINVATQDSSSSTFVIKSDLLQVIKSQPGRDLSLRRAGVCHYGDFMSIIFVKKYFNKIPNPDTQTILTITRLGVDRVKPWN